MIKHNFLNKIDTIIIILLISFSLIFYLVYNFSSNNNNQIVKIKYNNKIIKELPLNIDTMFSPIDGVVIEIKDNKAHFKHSNCQDKVCVNTGWVSKQGQTAICLPNKISIQISSSITDIDTQI